MEDGRCEKKGCFKPLAQLGMRVATLGSTICLIKSSKASESL
jgi:hypothetical protein